MCCSVREQAQELTSRSPGICGLTAGLAVCSVVRVRYGRRRAIVADTFCYTSIRIEL